MINWTENYHRPLCRSVSWMIGTLSQTPTLLQQKFSRACHSSTTSCVFDLHSFSICATNYGCSCFKFTAWPRCECVLVKTYVISNTAPGDMIIVAWGHTVVKSRDQYIVLLYIDGWYLGQIKKSELLTCRVKKNLHETVCRQMQIN